jgi:hypothetical protein
MDAESIRYYRYRFPPLIISHAVWLYHRFCLSFRDVEDLLAQRGVTVSYETVRHWCLLDSTMRVGFGAVRGASVTTGIWMSCLSRFKGNGSICGVPSTRTVTSSTFSWSLAETGGRRHAFSESS